MMTTRLIILKSQLLSSPSLHNGGITERQPPAEGWEKLKDFAKLSRDQNIERRRAQVGSQSEFKDFSDVKAESFVDNVY